MGLTFLIALTLHLQSLAIESSAWSHTQLASPAYKFQTAASHLHPHAKSRARGGCFAASRAESHGLAGTRCRAEERRSRLIDGVEVLYEDDDLVVLNKPSNVLVHPSASTLGVKPKSVVERLSLHYRSVSASEAVPETFSGILEESVGGVASTTSSAEGRAHSPASVVHRLDEGTSGVLLVAKTTAARLSLRQQFKQRAVKKTYVAVIHKGLRGALTVTSLIGRDLNNRRKMQSLREFSAASAARPHSSAMRTRGAVTFLKPILSNGKYGVVLASPVTGRTHQIRLHLQMMNAPIIGDTVYGDSSANSHFIACLRSPGTPSPEGQLQKAGLEKGRSSISFALRPLLHAAKVCCVHPTTGEPLTFFASLPQDMREAMSAVSPLWISVPELIPFSGDLPEEPLKRAPGIRDP